MRVAFLIMAHNTPRHVRRMVSALRHPGHSFFIHVDAKADIRPFLAVKNVTFIEDRTRVYWGDFSQVEAALSLLRAAISGGYDYYVLLSGSDYPLRTAEDINRFFHANSGTEFINLVPMPNEEVGKSLSRIELYHPRPNRPWQRLFRGRRRDWRGAFNGVKPFAGSQWWALTQEAARAALAFADSQTRLVRFLRNSAVPDEMFFQTAIGNSPHRKNVRRALFYADWNGGPSPAILTERHMSMLANGAVGCDSYGEGPLLFARKFPDNSTGLIRRLEAAKRTPK